MVKIPNSMEELVYFTKRTYGEKGRVTAWAYKSTCPKCKKGMMGKPLDPKTKRPKIRATEYECPECGHTIEKKEYEDTLTLEATYTCKKCGHQGEISIPFKRKSVQLIDDETGKKTAVKAFIFNCSKCDDKFVIAKKLKGE